MSDDEDDKRPSNVVDLIIKKSSAPTRLTSSAVLDGLELTKVFLTIRSAAERKRILRMVRDIANSDANKKS
jgi:hypothetical protein